MEHELPLQKAIGEDLMVKSRYLLFTGLLVLAHNLPAPRTSINYELVSESIDTGGKQSISTNYSIVPSIGLQNIYIEDATEMISIRAGYPGQLYEVVGIVVTASPLSVNEGDQSQLTAKVNYDDGTYILPDSTGVTWSRVDGPVDDPTNSGLVTTLFVYENSVATLGGTFAGKSDNGSLTIINSDSDNYYSYGSDNIEDNWQVFHFGSPPNSDANPDSNPDNDPSDNMMEFLTGFDPNDPTEWFKTIITHADAGEVRIQLNKVIPERTYTIETGTDLLSFPDTISILNPSSEEAYKVITDSSFSTDRRFYRVNVSSP